MTYCSSLSSKSIDFELIILFSSLKQQYLLVFRPAIAYLAVSSKTECVMLIYKIVSIGSITFPNLYMYVM